MLSIPKNDNAEKLVRELFRIKLTCPAIMEWFESEEKNLHKINTKMKDIDTLRCNQGALQLLDALFKRVREARDTYDRLTKGE